MYHSAKTLDDLMHVVLDRLVRVNRKVTATRGSISEIFGVLLKLKNPLSRLSRTETKGHVFSCLGELLWYLSGSASLDFVSYYIPAYVRESEDGISIHGAYGPRLFSQRGHDQIENVIKLLRSKPTSKRAVIQLFNAEDISFPFKEIPCTCTLQFLLRKKGLHLFVTMRSNDAYKGLPHDIFAFTMLQEIVARTLGCDLGYYKHFVGSLHLYEEDASKARTYLQEGWQATKPMPPMPLEDPWSAIQRLIAIEPEIRTGALLSTQIDQLSPYWADLARLLQVYRHAKNNDIDGVRQVKHTMASNIYHAYINKKSKKKVKLAAPEQMTIEFTED
jgi:thymidylate synthase